MAAPSKPASKTPAQPSASPPPGPAGVNAPKMAVPSGPVGGTRTVLVAVNGWGKTTIGAYAEDPVMLISPDEMGYPTLLSRGLVPAVPAMQPRSWPEALACIESLARDQQGRKTIVVDALAGFEHLLARHICKTQFGGDWSKTGFLSWNEGPRVVARIWPMLLARLLACARAGMDILILGHAKIEKFENPDGANYDRYVCNCGHADLWARTKDWAEAVLFGNFRAIVDTARPETNTAKAKGKAIGQQRLMRAQFSSSADAKNQYGLQPEYIMPDNPEECASAFWRLIKGDAE